MPTRKCKRLILPCLVILGIYVLLLGIQVVGEQALLSPTRQAETLSGFQRAWPDAEVVEVEQGGKKYYVCFGTQFLFNEYPAGYLFDSSRRLVGWEAEAGDTGRLALFWSRARARTWSRMNLR
jgi:hypothetical protein